jgi:hypothetical protein
MADQEDGFHQAQEQKAADADDESDTHALQL